MEELNLDGMENEALETFGERYMAEAMRIVTTKIILPQDTDMIQYTMALCMGIYMQKLRNGEIERDKVVH